MEVQNRHEQSLPLQNKRHILDSRCAVSVTLYSRYTHNIVDRPRDRPVCNRKQCPFAWVPFAVFSAKVVHLGKCGWRGKSGWSWVSINTECANNRYDAANAKSYDSVNIIVRYLAYKYSGARCFEIHLEYALKMQLNTNFSQNM